MDRGAGAVPSEFSLMPEFVWGGGNCGVQAALTFKIKHVVASPTASVTLPPVLVTPALVRHAICPGAVQPLGSEPVVPGKFHGDDGVDSLTVYVPGLS